MFGHNGLLFDWYRYLFEKDFLPKNDMIFNKLSYFLASHIGRHRNHKI
ncbi:hypothetical protein BGS_0920 [Beggiatoa sp. SS]|nr:hypothetical protein BGS_0920 [Beggiatoa sp. SS]